MDLPRTCCDDARVLVLLIQGPKGSTLPGPCDSPAVSTPTVHSVLFIPFSDSLLCSRRSICLLLQLIRFFLGNDVTVGDLRIENSPKFHLKFDDCQHMRADGLLLIDKLALLILF
jgi:hypothetical protein